MNSESDTKLLHVLIFKELPSPPFMGSVRVTVGELVENVA